MHIYFKANDVQYYHHHHKVRGTSLRPLQWSVACRHRWLRRSVEWNFSIPPKRLRSPGTHETFKILTTKNLICIKQFSKMYKHPLSVTFRIIFYFLISLSLWLHIGIKRFFPSLISFITNVCARIYDALGILLRYVLLKIIQIEKAILLPVL